MANWTPQQIVAALYHADGELRTLAAQYAWFKGQRDHWKDVHEIAVARATVKDDGPATKAKAAAVAYTSEIPVEVPWLDGSVVYLPDMVRLTEASFDLVSKQYARMETHIMILTVVNKNVMMDYIAGKHD